MTTPTQQILEKIKELGDDQAAKYFGKKKSTVQMWKRTGNVPITAYETFLANETAAEHLFGAGVPRPTPTAAQSEPEPFVGKMGTEYEKQIPPAVIHERFLAAEQRLDALESALLQRVAAPPSMVRPLETVSTTNAPQPPPLQPGAVSGIAPTKEQSEGYVGLPAQPAPHMKIAPTDPGATMGWNRPLAPRGNGGAVRAGH